MTLEKLDDLDTEYARLSSTTDPAIRRFIQAIHAGISRRDWYATEVAANGLRDHFDRQKPARPAPVPEAAPSGIDVNDYQMLLHLKDDNKWDGARPVIESDMKAWEQARRLSKIGLIAIENVALGGRLHITLKGLAALDAFLPPAPTTQVTE